MTSMKVLLDTFPLKACSSCKIDHKIGAQYCWQMTHSNER